MNVDFINVFPEPKYSFSKWMGIIKIEAEIKKNIPIIRVRNRTMIENISVNLGF